MATWQTHRFRDCVAVSAGNGETVYLTAAQAKAMARAINAAARSVQRERFSAAPSLTRSGDCYAPDSERTRSLPVMARDEAGKGIRYE
jgi:hypothetical protein